MWHIKGKNIWGGSFEIFFLQYIHCTWTPPFQTIGLDLQICKLLYWNVSFATDWPTHLDNTDYLQESFYCARPSSSQEPGPSEWARSFANNGYTRPPSPRNPRSPKSWRNRKIDSRISWRDQTTCSQLYLLNRTVGQFCTMTPGGKLVGYSPKPRDRSHLRPSQTPTNYPS